MPTKIKEYNQEIIQLPEFQSSIPAFGQSSNPIDLNMAVQNRFTGAQNTVFVDNTAGLTTLVQDHVFEIPFDVKGVQSYAQYFKPVLDEFNNLANGYVQGICNGYSVKPFGDTIKLFSEGGFLGNCNGVRHELFIHTNLTKDMYVLNFPTEDVMGSTEIYDITNVVVEVGRTPYSIPVWTPRTYTGSVIGLMATARPTAEARVYPIVREDRRVILRSEVDAGRNIFCALTFL